MLAARINFNHKLIAPHTSPVFNFTENSGTVTLNIAVTLDSAAFILADDQDNTGDTQIKANYRDARIGAGLLSYANLSTIQISMIDPAEGGSTFTLSGTLGTKVPGTGIDFKSLEFKKK